MVGTGVSKMLFRWGLAASTSVLVYFTGLYLYILTLFIPTIGSLLAWYIGVATGAFTPLALKFLAPGYKRVAFALGALFTLIAAQAMQHPPIWSCAVGALIFGFAAGINRSWNPFRSRPATTAILITALVVIPLTALYFDWPATPDPIPEELQHALHENSAGLHAFYEYDLSGFMEREKLWRLDLTREALEKIVSGLKLSHTVQVPPDFFQQPPYYWPNELPAGAEAYINSDQLEGHGTVNSQKFLFLLFDKSTERAFVLYSSGF